MACSTQFATASQHAVSLADVDKLGWLGGPAQSRKPRDRPLQVTGRRPRPEGLRVTPVRRERLNANPV